LGYIYLIDLDYPKLIRMRLLLFFLLTISFFSCKKKANQEQTIPPTQTPVAVSGTIQLPAGSGLNLSGWTISAGLSDTTLKDNKYALGKVSNDFDIVFLADQNGNDRMMGIYYEGQTDFTINSASTVLAMLMKMPAVNSLTAAGKLNLLNSLKANPGFTESVAAFEQRFLQNVPLFDQSDTLFRNKLANLFQKVAGRMNGGFRNIDFIRAGKTIAFQNPGWAFAQTIGVYKNGSRVAMLSLDRYQWFANSLPELMNLYGNPPNPIKTEYTMDGDGIYEFKVRTGKPFTGLTGLEAEFAFADNYTNVVMDQIAFFVKHLPFFSFRNECAASMRSFAKSQVASNVSLLSQNNSSPLTIGTLLTQITLTTLDLISSSTECVTNLKEEKFLGKVKQFMRFIGWFSDLGNIMNSTAFITMYPLAPAAFDTCLTVQGTSVNPCNIQTVTIGTQVWMRRNLDVTSYRNGDPIPQVTDPFQWEFLTTGAWCYYGNDPSTGAMYGKLYNWYALNDPRGLAPAGWHIPSDGEWTTLTDFLGGALVAGRKMKAVTGWKDPNDPKISGDNSSGFTALPGGYRWEYGGQFETIYANGIWWSSTVKNTDSASIRFLTYNTVDVGKAYLRMPAGCSVRCLKD
jgi:uncharacterized protein (TIGR02145 family)